MAQQPESVEELEDKVGKVEKTLQGHGSRLDVVELCFEKSQQYRFLRVECSPALDGLWTEVEKRNGGQKHHTGCGKAFGQ